EIGSRYGVPVQTQGVDFVLDLFSLIQERLHFRIARHDGTINDETYRTGEQRWFFRLGVGLFRSIVGDQRGLRRATPFLFLKAFRSAYRIFERFPHGNFAILIFVGRVALKRFEEVVVEDDFIAFLAASGRCDDNPVLTRKLFKARTAGGRGSNNYNFPDSESG